MQAVKDASHLYEVERRARHAERPGFRISELQLSPTQQVPWHYHTNIQDTFYVLEGEIRLFLREPKEDVRLKPGETYAVRPGRAHLVTNSGKGSAVFLVLQGIGEYDYVPLDVRLIEATRQAGCKRTRRYSRGIRSRVRIPMSELSWELVTWRISPVQATWADGPTISSTR